MKSVNPVYPSSAQRLGVAGSITVNALIDEKGNVIDTAILKGIKDDPGLARSAENAVKKVEIPAGPQERRGRQGLEIVRHRLQAETPHAAA